MNTTHKSYWKENTLFGLLIGGSFSMASLLFIWGGKSVAMNPQLNNVIMLLTIFGVFVGAKKYRDEALGGVISYGKAHTLLETFNMFLMPVSIAMGEFFNHIVTGGIFTVLLAWFVKRKPQDFQQQV